MFTLYQKADIFTIYYIYMDYIVSGLFVYLIILFSAVVHEFFHGWTANYLGDPTAKHLGRLTLNPIKHMDLIGTLILPLILIVSHLPFIGWAKPVPYNPYNLRDQRFGNTKVALAGPLANMLIAIVFGLTIRFAPIGPNLFMVFSYIVVINLYLCFFNLIPVPPLDGSKLLLDLFPRAAYSLSQLAFGGIFIALIISYAILRPIANFFYHLIVGSSLIF